MTTDRSTEPQAEACPTHQVTAALRDVLRDMLEPVAQMEALAKKKLLTGTEVERLYGLNYGTLRNWRRQGRGPQTVQIGASVYYEHEALQAFIGAHRVRTYDQR